MSEKLHLVEVEAVAHDAAVPDAATYGHRLPDSFERARIALCTSLGRAARRESSSRAIRVDRLAVLALVVWPSPELERERPHRMQTTDDAR